MRRINQENANILSNGERLILAMLCDISKNLDAGHEIDPNFVMKALGTHEWALSWQYSGLVESPTPQVVDETASILTMWRMLEQGFANLNEADRQKVRDSVNRGNEPVQFLGFDGNNDDHYGVARFMVEELGRFEELKGRNLNSHTQSTLPRYRRMLRRFDIAKFYDDPSADRIIGILKD